MKTTTFASLTIVATGLFITAATPLAAKTEAECLESYVNKCVTIFSGPNTQANCYLWATNYCTGQKTLSTPNSGGDPLTKPGKLRKRLAIKPNRTRRTIKPRRRNTYR